MVCGGDGGCHFSVFHPPFWKLFLRLSAGTFFIHVAQPAAVTVRYSCVGYWVRFSYPVLDHALWLVCFPRVQAR